MKSELLLVDMVKPTADAFISSISKEDAFVFIGPQKCGTSSLHFVLSQFVRLGAKEYKLPPFAFLKKILLTRHIKSYGYINWPYLIQEDTTTFREFVNLTKSVHPSVKFVVFNRGLMDWIRSMESQYIIHGKRELSPKKIELIRTNIYNNVNFLTESGCSFLIIDWFDKTELKRDAVLSFLQKFINVRVDRVVPLSELSQAQKIRFNKSDRVARFGLLNWILVHIYFSCKFLAPDLFDRLASNPKIKSIFFKKL